MIVRFPSVLWWFLCLFPLLVMGGSAAADDDELAAQVKSLVVQLDADTLSERDVAEANLLSLASIEGIGEEKLLTLLPEPNDRMPAAVRDRLSAIRKTLEEQLARQAIAASTVSLEAINWPLMDVLEELEKRTGNKIIDSRAQFGGQATNPDVVLQVEAAPFWSALDQVLDQAKLSPYAFAGEDAVSLVDREPGERDRYGRAVYSGPFRFEVTDVTANRGLRNPKRQSLNLDLEIAWEPRLRPIALTQPLDHVEAVDEAGQRLPVAQPGRVFHMEVQEGRSATTIKLPLELPDRAVNQIATLRGGLTALVPAGRHAFRFDDLTRGEPITQSRGGVHITLDRVTENNAIWEVHMRLRLDADNDALASHRGWVFNNMTYLVGDDGEPIDHVGFETTKQTKNEVGIAFLYDLPDGIDGLTWVYESPVAIVEQRYAYELMDISLP